MDNNIIETLKKAARFSDINQQHAAALIKNNKIYAIAINDIVKKIDFISETGEVRCRKITRHSEENVIFKLPKKIIKELDIIVIRINNNSKMIMSRPCTECKNKLIKFGIKKVYYSNEQGNIVYEYTNLMEKTYISKGHRK